MKENDIQAFPYSSSSNGWAEDGMTVRDYFAAKALQSYLSALSAVAGDGTEGAIKSVPRASYEIADQMLEERDSY